MKTRRLLLPLTILLLSGISVYARTSPPPPDSSTAAAGARSIRRVDLQTNYWNFYAPPEDIYLESLERLPDGIGVNLQLRSARRVLFFRYATNGGSFQKSVDGTALVRFQPTDLLETQYSTTVVIAVFPDLSSSKPYTININYYPGARYAASGQTDPGRIIVHQTDIALKRPSVQDWLLHRPGPAEQNFARHTWGHLIDPGRTDYENAMALAAALIDELDPHVGVPSDKMYALHPFQQYLRAKAGEDQLWCTNISEIFAYACNSLGIACRSIVANRTLPAGSETNGNGYKLVLAQGHRTTEIFSRQLNQWIWMDLTFYVLGAYLGPVGPVNLAEFHMFLNNPNRVEHLNLIEFDPDLHTQIKSTIAASNIQEDLFNYFKRDQQFYYLTESLTPMP